MNSATKFSKTNVTFEKLKKNSDDFFHNNPGCKVQTQDNMIGSKEHHRDKIEMFANKAYPVIHEKVVNLIEDFLRFKKLKGTLVERSLYSKMP